MLSLSPLCGAVGTCGIGPCGYDTEFPSLAIGCTIEVSHVIGGR
jgi:hypothetical protein